MGVVVGCGVNVHKNKAMRGQNKKSPVTHRKRSLTNLMRLGYKTC